MNFIYNCIDCFLAFKWMCPASIAYIIDVCK